MSKIQYWSLIHRKQWLCPDMTEKLLTGTCNHKTNKQDHYLRNYINRNYDRDVGLGVETKVSLKILLHYRYCSLLFEKCKKLQDLRLLTATLKKKCMS